MVEYETSEVKNIETNPNVEKLKLFKNTKGYNWEIQIIGIDMDRLKDLNNQMINNYGLSE